MVKNLSYLLTIFTILFMSNLAFAGNVSLKVKSGSISFEAKAGPKTVVGKSTLVSGKFKFNPENPSKSFKVAVSAPVKSFKSGDGNRDDHMLEATEALLSKYSLVTIIGTKLAKNNISSSKTNKGSVVASGSLTLTAQLKFHGVVKSYKIPASLTYDGKNATAKGSFTVSLKNHKIKAPCLAGVACADDKITISFNVVFG